jgi:hypothetical protein
LIKKWEILVALLEETFKDSPFEVIKAKDDGWPELHIAVSGIFRDRFFTEYEHEVCAIHIDSYAPHNERGEPRTPSYHVFFYNPHEAYGNMICSFKLDIGDPELGDKIRAHAENYPYECQP